MAAAVGGFVPILPHCLSALQQVFEKIPLTLQAIAQRRVNDRKHP